MYFFRFVNKQCFCYSFYMHLYFCCFFIVNSSIKKYCISINFFLTSNLPNYIIQPTICLHTYFSIILDLCFISLSHSTLLFVAIHQISVETGEWDLVTFREKEKMVLIWCLMPLPLIKCALEVPASDRPLITPTHHFHLSPSDHLSHPSFLPFHQFIPFILPLSIHLPPAPITTIHPRLAPSSLPQRTTHEFWRRRQ